MAGSAGDMRVCDRGSERRFRSALNYPERKGTLLSLSVLLPEKSSRTNHKAIPLFDNTHL